MLLEEYVTDTALGPKGPVNMFAQLSLPNEDNFS